jgi:hypothetical protein
VFDWVDRMKWYSDANNIPLIYCTISYIKNSNTTSSLVQMLTHSSTQIRPFHFSTSNQILPQDAQPTKQPRHRRQLPLVTTSSRPRSASARRAACALAGAFGLSKWCANDDAALAPHVPRSRPGGREEGQGPPPDNTALPPLRRRVF